MKHGTISTYTNKKCRCDLCKAAMSEYQRARRDAEVIKEFERAYRLENAEAIKERQRAYRLENAEVINEYQRAYRLDNVEAIKERQRAYYLNNTEKKKASIAKWRREHPEARAAHKDTRRSKARKLSTADRQELIAHLKRIKDDRCYYCEQRTEKMHNDHVMPLSRGGSPRYWNVVRTCSTCNLRKGSKADLEYVATMPFRESP